jgi:hypothetical protein
MQYAPHQKQTHGAEKAARQAPVDELHSERKHLFLMSITSTSSAHQ